MTFIEHSKPNIVFTSPSLWTTLNFHKHNSTWIAQSAKLFVCFLKQLLQILNSTVDSVWTVVCYYKSVSRLSVIIQLYVTMPTYKTLNILSKVLVFRLLLISHYHEHLISMPQRMNALRTCASAGRSVARRIIYCVSSVVLLYIIPNMWPYKASRQWYFMHMPTTH